MDSQCPIDNLDGAGQEGEISHNNYCALNTILLLNELVGFDHYFGVQILNFDNLVGQYFGVQILNFDKKAQKLQEIA